MILGALGLLAIGASLGVIADSRLRSRQIAGVEGRVLALQADLIGLGERLASTSGDLQAVTKQSATHLAALRSEIEGLSKAAPSLSKVAERSKDAIGMILCGDDGGSIVSTGSGTVFRRDGRVLTNYHVIAESLPDDSEYYTGAEIPCVFAYEPWKDEPQLYALRVAGLHPETDIAILQLYDAEDGANLKSDELKNLETLGIRSCGLDALRAAEPIIIVGYPNYAADGIDPTLLNVKVTTGAISSVLASGDVTTDAKIEHGNSGGAAFTSSGCFVGVPTAVLAGEVETMGIIRRFPGT